MRRRPKAGKPAFWCKLKQGDFDGLVSRLETGTTYAGARSWLASIGIQTGFPSLPRFYHRFCDDTKAAQLPWLTPNGKEVEFEVTIVARQPGQPARQVGSIYYTWPRKPSRRVVKGACDSQAAPESKGQAQ